MTQAYAAGLFEGQVASLRIWQSANNLHVMDTLDPLILAFINAQQKWLQQQIAANPQSDYWVHVALVEEQLRGIVDGYNKAAPTSQKLTPLQIRLLNLGAEIGDIAAGIVPGQEHRSGDDEFSHCSALLKWLPDRSDILISQVTWSSFESMLRVFKLYDLPMKRVDGSNGMYQFITRHYLISIPHK
jgi:hypothetical protein